MPEYRVWLGAFVATVLTWGHGRLDPFWVEGAELLPMPEATVLTTEIGCGSSCEEQVFYDVVLPDGPGFRLSGATDLADTGNRARLFVLTTGPEGNQQWFGSPRLEAGQRSATVFVPGEMSGRRARAGAVLDGPDGRLEVQGLTLRVARRSWFQQGLWWLSASTWIAVAAVAVRRVAVSVSPRWRVPLAFWLGMTGVGALFRRHWMGWIVASVPLDPYTVYKGIGHAGGFGLLAGLGVLAGGAPGRVFRWVVGAGAAIEMMQTLTASRSGRWEDLGFDAVGALFGCAVAWLFVRRTRHEG